MLSAMSFSSNPHLRTISACFPSDSRNFSSAALTNSLNCSSSLIWLLTRKHRSSELRRRSLYVARNVFSFFRYSIICISRRQSAYLYCIPSYFETAAGDITVSLLMILYIRASREYPSPSLKDRMKCLPLGALMEIYFRRLTSYPFAFSLSTRSSTEFTLLSMMRRSMSLASFTFHDVPVLRCSQSPYL